MNAENVKRKKKEKIIIKAAQQNAKVQNMAHLAAVLGNATTTNIAAQTFIPPMNNRNVQVNGSENFSTDIPQNEVLETGIQNQPIVVPIDSARAAMPPNDAQVVETGIQNRTAVPPIELPSAVTNNYSNIVRLAMEGLEGVDFFNIGDLDFPEGVDIAFMDEYRSDANVASTSETGQDLTKTILIDVPLNGCDFGNVQKILDSAIDNSLSTISTSLPKQQNCGTGETANIKYSIILISKMYAFLEKTFAMQEQHDVSVGEIDYKKAFLQLKEKNSSLDERNLALQNALVAADKALGKVPEVSFTDMVSRNKFGNQIYALNYRLIFDCNHIISTDNLLDLFRRCIAGRLRCFAWIDTIKNQLLNHFIVDLLTSFRPSYWL